MNATIGTLLSVKKQMHNTLENFDSQKSLSNQTKIVVDKVNATMEGISGFGVSLGVFDAFDNIFKENRPVSGEKLDLINYDDNPF